MKRRVLLSFFGVISILIVVLVITLVPRRIFNYEVENIAKVTILNGINGELIELTEKDDVDRIVYNLNSVSFQRNGISPKAGFSYKVTLYDKNDKQIDSITITGNGNISYKQTNYKATKNKIDLKYYENLYTNR